MDLSNRQLVRAFAVAAIGALAVARAHAVTVDRYWEVTPYRMQFVVLIDLPTDEAMRLDDGLADYVNARVATAVGPIWKLTHDVRRSTAANRDRVEVDDLVADELKPTLDKVMLIRVQSSPGGFSVVAREYDFYASEWGREVVAETSELGYARELIFRLATQVFAPVATYKTKRGDDSSVSVSFKASALPRRGSIDWTPPGALLAPILRRIESGGEPAEDGTNRVEWTYLEVEESDPPATSARVHSHTKRPFSFRMRGRVERIAVLVRGEPAPVKLRLFDRLAPEKGLSGLDIYLQNLDEKATRFLGKTDRYGSIEVPPGPTRIQTAYVKAGTQAIAKIPLVPGDLELVEAPRPDYRQRLAAEAKVAAISEDLIDVVARRTIMAARINRMIEKGEFAAAREVLTDLGGLPVRSHFADIIDREQKRIEVDDPTLKAQIDKLFSDTKSVLNEFLDASLSAKLRSKLIAEETSRSQASR